MDDWVVYLARTDSGQLYTGISNDPQSRVEKHNSGKGAKFARFHSRLTLVYTSESMTRSEALKREYDIKSWSKAKKEQLVQGV